jgi:hypothetical protein
MIHAVRRIQHPPLTLRLGAIAQLTPRALRGLGSVPAPVTIQRYALHALVLAIAGAAIVGMALS